MKKLFTLLFLLTAFISNAQNNLNRITGLSSTTASVAYSLRQLSTSYTGPIVRIKVNSLFYDVYPDATTYNFTLSSKISASISTYNAAVSAASANALSSIITAGTTNATVAIWYDQSGNAVHVLNASALATIITSGTINTMNGQPTINFTSTNSYLTSSVTVNYSSQTVATLNAAVQDVASTDYISGIISTGNNGGWGLCYDPTSTIKGYWIDASGSSGASSKENTKDAKIVTGLIGKTTDSYIYINSQLKDNKTAQSIANGLTDNIYVGVRGNASNRKFIGNISEVFMFPKTLSAAEQTALETSQSIFLGPFVTITSSASGAVCAGTSVTFTATTYNFTGTPTYQWYKNSVAINGETNASYTTSTLANADQIYVIASAVTSNSLTANITAGPSAVVTVSGDGCINKTTLSTPAGQSAYAWYKDNAPISGAISNTYSPTTAGDYKVQVTSGTCSTMSAITTISVCGVTGDGKMMSLAFAAPLVSTDGGANVGTGIDEQGKIHNTTGITTTKGTIGETTAIIGGVIGSTNGISSSVGVVYSTDSNFGTSSTVTIQSNVAAGTYTSTISGLSSSTTYYAKAFIVNKAGTSYGAVISFATVTVPTLAATTAASSIAGTTATTGGNVSADGGAAVTARGIVWGTTPNPTIALTTKTTDGTGTGAFTSSLTGLTTATLYYVRSYATNAIGTVYGTEISFTTLGPPTLASTTAASAIAGTTATTGGNVSADGGAAVTARGVVYGTTTGSATFSVSSGTGTGTYTTSLTGLTPVTTYYVRSFATNSVGTVYGTETSFTTSAGPASKAMINIEPSGAAAGTAFTTQPVVRITDASGNTVTTSTVNVVASIASGTGTLGGTTTVAAVNGVATFTNLVLSGATGNFTLAFTPTSLTAATSNSFALSFGTASKAMITIHPSGADNGVALTTQPVIRITDASGNTVTSSTVNVVASIGSGTGGTLSGTTTVAAVNGVATFTNLVLSGTPGSFTLTFTPTSLTAAPSNSFALSVGTASKVMVTTQPSGAFNGIAFSTQPVVKITDAGGNTITSSTASVIASIASGTGTLSGTTTIAAVNGVATFTNLKITGTGDHTLTFTPAGGLTAATSNSLNVAELGCAQGGNCAIGDTGPGGGTVFYYSAAGFNCGPNFTDRCNYLEVAPNTWSGGTADPILRWDPTSGDDNLVGYPDLVTDSYPAVTAHINESEIGLGYKSSVYLVNYYITRTSDPYAAGAARGYTGGGKTDWYLGTSVEMNLLGDWSKGNAATPTVDSSSGTLIRGGFLTIGEWYWTASQLDWAKENAYKQDFSSNGSGGSYQDHKNARSRAVRPIRAF